MESQPQNPEFRNNPELSFTHEIVTLYCFIQLIAQKQVFLSYF